jgi:hypothetical protein
MDGPGGTGLRIKLESRAFRQVPTKLVAHGQIRADPRPTANTL